MPNTRYTDIKGVAMKRRKKIMLIAAVLLLLSLACQLTPEPPDVDENAIGTSVALTEAAVQPPADTPAAAASEPTPDPDTIFAPDPLTVAYTGLIWEFGACYDFDAYQPAAAAEPAVDACLDANGTITPRNGALMSGQASMQAPSKGDCINPSLLPDPLAPNTDLYLCLQTNQGVYGFFVMREFQLDLNRLVFDLYLFP
jgi:hypothetical protein